MGPHFTTGAGSNSRQRTGRALLGICLVAFVGAQCAQYKVKCDPLDGQCQPLTGLLLYSLLAAAGPPVDWLVTVGSAGSAYFSADRGKTWTAGATGTTDPLTGVAYAGAGRWVAVGGSDRMIYSDDGGGTWKNATTPSAGSNNQALAFGNGILLAVGTVANISRSTDGGVVWSGVVNPIGPVKNNADYACGTFLFASNGDVAHTADGTGAVSAASLPNFPTGKAACTAANRIVMATGAAPFAYYSDDLGVNWTGGAVGIAALRRAVRRLGTQLFAFGDDANMYTTADASSWSAAIPIPISNIKDAAAIDSTRMVAVGGGAAALIMYTEDGGASWSAVAGLPATPLTAVAYGQIPKPN